MRNEDCALVVKGKEEKQQKKRRFSTHKKRNIFNIIAMSVFSDFQRLWVSLQLSRRHRSPVKSKIITSQILFNLSARKVPGVWFIGGLDRGRQVVTYSSPWKDCWLDERARAGNAVRGVLGASARRSWKISRQWIRSSTAVRCGYTHHQPITKSSIGEREKRSNDRQQRSRRGKKKKKTRSVMQIFTN